MSYEVTYGIVGSFTLGVEAESEEEAKEKADALIDSTDAEIKPRLVNPAIIKKPIRFVQGEGGLSLSPAIGEEAEKQPEPIPPEPQGMDLLVAWEFMKNKTVYGAWPEHWVSFYYYTTPLQFAEMKAVVDRVGGKPFYQTLEEAEAHIEWLMKYGEVR